MTSTDSEDYVPVFLRPKKPIVVKGRSDYHPSPRHVEKDRTVLEHGVGAAKWFSEKSGFGFLTFTQGPDKGKDIFVHIQAVSAMGQDFLQKGKIYEFDINHRRSDGRPFAINLKEIRG